MSGPTPDGTPSQAELAMMSQDELVRLGSELDGITVVSNRDRWPVKGTRAERRAERAVGGWFALAALFGAGFIVVYIIWPWRYTPPGTAGSLLYNLYTPMLGVFLGLSILLLGVGAIAYSKRFLPEDLTIQQRHDGRSAEIDRATVVARLVQVGQTSGFARRSFIKRSAGAAAGIFGLGLGIAAIGGLVNDPWAGGNEAALWTTGWRSDTGEKVYLRSDTGHPDDVQLVRPEDMAAGGILTVFPFKESERNNPQKLLEALMRSDNPVMLLRFRPNTPVIKRAGQEDFNYGDYYAYSKICTHLGCDAALYEEQTMRLLCPCHQSQFQANEYAKPVFGPAARPLPQLPIDVDSDGYFYAKHDFIEAIGPGFWERPS